MADGAPGLWKAARELWPSAEEQRCTVHALRKVTAKLIHNQRGYARAISPRNRDASASAVLTALRAQRKPR